MLTVIEQLSAVAHATALRRASGHAMTYAAGQQMLQHSAELVHLAQVVGDYLAGDAPKAALAGAFVPFLARVEEAVTS